MEKQKNIKERQISPLVSIKMVGGDSRRASLPMDNVYIDVFHWAMYNLTLPLVLIVVFPLLCCIYPQTRQAFRAILEDGILFVFSGMLLLGVKGMLEQTRVSVKYPDLNKGLSHRAALLLFLGITILMVFCCNFLFNTLDEFKVLPREDFAGTEATWILVGVVTTLVAILFSLYAIYYNNNIFFLLHQRRGEGHDSW